MNETRGGSGDRRSLPSDDSRSPARIALAGIAVLLVFAAVLLLFLPADGTTRDRRARAPETPSGKGSLASLDPALPRAPGGTAPVATSAGPTESPKGSSATVHAPKKHAKLAGIASIWSGSAPDPIDPDAAANKRTGVRGRVVDSRGAAVEGASVVLTGSKDGSHTKVFSPGGAIKALVVRTAGNAGAGMPMTLGAETSSREAKTDADGRFEVLGLSAAYSYQIEVTPPPAYVDATEDAPSLKQDEVVDAGDVKVARAARITGTVYMPTGEPARGAWVALDDGPGSFASGGTAVFAMSTQSTTSPDATSTDDTPPDGLVFADPVKTDDQGRFAIERVAPGSHSVVAAKRGFRAARSPKIEARDGEAQDGLELKLKDPLKLVVVARDRDKNPIRGAKVSAGPGGFVMGASQGPQVATDDRGEALLTGLTSSEFTVSIQADGYVPLQRSIQLDVDSDRRVFVLQNGTDVTGQIVDKDGNPVKDASVWPQLQVAGGQTRDDMLQNMATYSSRDASGADGRFRLRGLAPGDYTIDAQAPGLSQAHKDISIPQGTREVDLGTLTLGSLGSIAVTVLDPEDKPISGAQVQTTRDLSGTMRLMTGYAGLGTATTDAQGQAEVKDLEPGSYTVTASKDGFSNGSAGGIQVCGGGTMSATVRLARGGLVNGMIVGADGMPKPRNYVSLLQQNQAFATAQTMTDQDGRFEFPHVASGTYRLLSNKGTEDMGGTWFSVAEGQTVTRTLQAQAMPTLDGTVRRADGSAVAGAQVAFGALNAFPFGSADAEVFPQKTATTDASGHYHMDGIASGPGQGITITTPEGKKVTYHVTFPDSGPCQRDVVLPAPGALAVVPAIVVDENQQAVIGATVTLDGDDLQGPVIHVERTTDETGSARLDGVPAGRSYRIGASASGYATTTLATAVSESPGVVRLVLPRGGSLLLQAQASGAAGFAWATYVAVSTSDPNDTHKAFAAFGQKVRISGLKVGATYEVTISAQGYQTTKLTLRCDGDSQTAQTLTLTPG